MTFDVEAWRRATRTQLIARRVTIAPGLRVTWSGAIARLLAALLDTLPVGILGITWPYKGEFDVRSMAGDLLAKGWRLALPVVVAKDQPLVYRAWTPESAMTRGVLGILVPAHGQEVVPTVLLAPLVGYDDARYRLGNGGGYFDRTLAVMNPIPLAIGVGFALGRLPTIHPQPHDRPMDIIVTENGISPPVQG